MKKLSLVFCLIFTSPSFATEEKETSNSSSSDSVLKKSYMTAKSVDTNIIPPLQELVNKYLIGDGSIICKL